MKFFNTLCFLIHFFIAVGLCSSAHADSFGGKCPNLVQCTKAVSELTGEKYIFNKRDYEISVTTTANLDFTKENAVELLTRALYDEGYTRVPMSTPGVYSIMRIREARDTALPEYKATKTITPQMPENYDSVQLTYMVNHEEAIEPICRHLRATLPHHSRIIPNDIVNSILITGSARDLKRIIATIREMDQKPSAALKAKWAKEAREEKEAQERRRERKKNKDRDKETKSS